MQAAELASLGQSSPAAGMRRASPVMVVERGGRLGIGCGVVANFSLGFGVRSFICSSRVVLFCLSVEMRPRSADACGVFLKRRGLSEPSAAKASSAASEGMPRARPSPRRSSSAGLRKRKLWGQVFHLLVPCREGRGWFADWKWQMHTWRSSSMGGHHGAAVANRACRGCVSRDVAR